jgi:hypothetical protein
MSETLQAICVSPIRSSPTPTQRRLGHASVPIRPRDNGYAPPSHLNLISDLSEPSWAQMKTRLFGSKLSIRWWLRPKTAGPVVDTGA